MNKPNELYHHGIMGMKWGVRRYQNEDGSLTPAGRNRYGVAKKTPFRQRYYESTARVVQKDADDLRKAGFHAEADAVQKLADKDRSKAKQIHARYLEKNKVKAAKLEYKQAKKQYSKDFYKYYNRSIAAYSPVKEHRRANDARLVQALVSAGEMGIKKGEYLAAKGTLKGNQKMIDAGRRRVEFAMNNRDFYRIILNDINAGNSYKQAFRNNSSAYTEALAREKAIKEKYKR